MMHIMCWVHPVWQVCTFFLVLKSCCSVSKKKVVSLFNRFVIIVGKNSKWCPLGAEESCFVLINFYGIYFITTLTIGCEILLFQYLIPLLLDFFKTYLCFIIINVIEELFLYFILRFSSCRKICNLWDEKRRWNFPSFIIYSHPEQAHWFNKLKSYFFLWIHIKTV